MCQENDSMPYGMVWCISVGEKEKGVLIDV